MSLLSVTVKKARYVGLQATQFNTYVTLKLQNVKSTTVTVKGPTPCWEQDFLFEINDINLGLLVEVWNKGVIWDRALGYHYLPLTSVAYNEQECLGRWIELEAQLMMRGGAVVGTTGPTGHALLLDCRFEPPFDAEGTGGADLQRKLDMLNGALDAERAEQARRQLQYVAHSGYSEDSDYTSDLNYPVGQHANCSASQFRSAAHQIHTPQRSLEASRENSYEREEYHMHGDTDPLYYNSQPRTNRIESWSQMQAQASVESAYSWRTAADWQSGEEQRRPSLERQNTLYDDNIGYGYDAYTTCTTHIRDHSHLSHETSYEEYYDSSSYPYGPYETRTWDSNRYLYDDSYGLTTTEYENTVNKRRSSVVQLPQLPSKQLPPSSRYSDYNEMAPYRPRPRRTAASLPATPSSTPKRGRALPLPPGSDHGSTRRGRRLPRPPRVSRLPPAPPASSVASVTSDVTIHTHVPYKQEPERAVPDISYGYDTYGYQSQYHDTATEQYQDTNYSTSYDEDGMQPFFDETPHATPPAATAQKPTWETETTTQLSYPITSDIDALIPNTTTAAVNFLPQPPVPKTQDSYLNQSYQQFDFQYEDQEQHKYEEQSQPYKEEHNEYLEPKNEIQYQPQYEQSYQDDLSQKQSFHSQYQQQEPQMEQENYYQNEYEEQKYEQQLYELQDYDHQQYEKQQYEQNQYDQQQYEIKHYEQKQELGEQFRQQQEQNLRDEQQKQSKQDQQRYLEQQQQQLQLQQHQQQQLQQQLQQQQQQHQQQQQQQQQQKLPTQQLQSSVLTGAATLGSLMAGGAKKLGSLFGAAAAAVAPSPISQPSNLTQASQVTVSQITSSTVPSTPFTSATVSITASVPEVPTPVTVSTVTTTSTPILPRTPSLRRQESIQRPSVRRTRTLPDAPEDYPQSSFDESAYDDDYQKTELDQNIDKDRTSLDRYHDDDYMHDTIHEDIVKESQAPEVSSPSLQNTASPTRVASQIRKPSVDSYHSQAPSIHDRKTSQSSVHIEEKLSIPTSQEDLINDKSKVTFQDDRTIYHEVPEEFDTFQESRDSFDEPISEYQDDHQSYHDRDEAFREESEKFDVQEQFNETDEQYNEEDTVFQEEEERHKVEQLDFQPEQPKLTPRQRWHRAYNKIVMQLNAHCKCRYECKSLDADHKLKLFQEYYGLADNEKQSTFLMSLIHLSPVKRRRHGKYVTQEQSRRQCTVFYVVPNGKGNIVNVCKATFVDLFAVSQKKLQVLIKRKKEGHTIYIEKRGNKKKHRKFTESDENNVKDHINSFPRLESHYGRARSQKDYLSPDLNIHRLFRAYKLHHPETVVTYKYYSSVFKKCFPNTKFGQKRTDTCATCDLLAAKMISDPSNRTIHKHQLELHQRRAERATMQMSFDIKKSQMPSSTTLVTSMDLQQVIVTPTLTHGAMYYSRQLSNYNLGVHVENTGDGYMLMWNESITGRGGNEIASCVFKLMNNNNVVLNKNNLIMWSDNCCGQNKNKMFLFLWAYLTYKKVFKTIEHKFLISGHSFLSCDRDFALIEKRKRVSNCMVPDDIKNVIENTRIKQPFRVVTMTVDDFLDFKLAADTFINSSTLQISKAHILKFDSVHPFVVRMKETHSTLESWKCVNLLKRRQTINQIGAYTLRKLQCKSKITAEKKKDLLAMIPYLRNEAHKNFYQSILND